MSFRREPYEVTDDLYPGLVVHDARVTGSITIGQSRLPMWAFLATAVYQDWAAVEAGWSPTEHYGFTENNLVSFLHDLLDARGDFARLLLAIANAERLEHLRDDAFYDQFDDGSGIVEVTDEIAAARPPAWWDCPELSAPVVDLLRRCLAHLESNDRPAGTADPVGELAAAPSTALEVEQHDTAAPSPNGAADDHPATRGG